MRLRDWLIGSAILLALIFWVQTSIGWAALLAPWQGLSPALLLGLLGLSALSYLFRAIRVYAYFPEQLRGRFLATLKLSVLHNFANNLLPMRAGEAAFPWLMQRYFGHGMGRSLFSLLWIRLLDLHFLGLIGLFALYLLYPSRWWGAAMLLALVGLPQLLFFSQRLRAGGEPPEGRIRRLIFGLADSGPADLRQLVRLYGLTVISWLTKFFAFGVILLHFLDVPLWQALLGIIGSELSSVLPIHGVAGSGSYELAMVAVLTPLGVDAKAVLAGAVNLHLFLLGVTLLLGLVAWLLPSGRSGSA